MRLPASSVTVCPSCANLLDWVTDACSSLLASGLAHAVGDVMICGHCAEVLIFGADLRPRQATVADLAALDESTRASIGRVQAAIRQRRAVVPPVALLSWAAHRGE